MDMSVLAEAETDTIPGSPSGVSHRVEGQRPVPSQSLDSTASSNNKCPTTLIDAERNAAISPPKLRYEQTVARNPSRTQASSNLEDYFELDRYYFHKSTLTTLNRSVLSGRSPIRIGIQDVHNDGSCPRLQQLRRGAQSFYSPQDIDSAFDQDCRILDNCHESVRTRFILVCTTEISSDGILTTGPPDPYLLKLLAAKCQIQPGILWALVEHSPSWPVFLKLLAEKSLVPHFTSCAFAPQFSDMMLDFGDTHMIDLGCIPFGTNPALLCLCSPISIFCCVV